MTASETPVTAVAEVAAVSTTSLNAYAAWLAKHETKAARKRIPDQVDVVASVEEEESEDQIQQEVEDPYLQWLRRKETKLPLVKVVVASPDRVDKAPITGSNQSNPGHHQDRENDDTTRGGDTTRKTTAVASRKTREVLSKGKKRLASSDLDGDEGGRADKKAKRASIEVSPSSSSSSSQHASPLEDPKTTTVARTPAVKLPMLEEVRYWRDVDRFSFLS